MKNFIAPALIAFVVAGFSAPGMAQIDHNTHGSHAAMQAPSTAATQLADGLVKKIDKSTARVTLSHGPLPDGMPAMTMAYRVKEATWLDKMKTGQKIRFAAESVDGAMTLVQFEPAK